MNTDLTNRWIAYATTEGYAFFQVPATSRSAAFIHSSEHKQGHVAFRGAQPLLNFHRYATWTGWEATRAHGLSSQPAASQLQMQCW